MVQHEGYGLGVKAGIERVEHRASRGNAEVRLHHGRRVGQHHGHRVALDNAAALQRTGQLAATREHFGPVAAQVAMDDSQPLRIDLGSPFDAGQRGQRRMIGPGAGKVLIKNRGMLVVSRVSGAMAIMLVPLP